MSILKIHEFDFSALTFSSDLKTGKTGNKYVQIGYGPDKDQVKVQLGKTVNDAFRTPWGKDAVSKNEPDKLQIKIDMTPELRAFIGDTSTGTKDKPPRETFQRGRGNSADSVGSSVGSVGSAEGHIPAPAPSDAAPPSPPQQDSDHATVQRV